MRKLGKLKHFMVEKLAYRCHVKRDIQLFYIPHEIFHSYEDITISGNWVEYFGLCSPSVPLSKAGSSLCHTCCDTGPWFLQSLPKDSPILSPGNMYGK